MHELQSWREEKSSAYLYCVVAEAEAGTTRAALFRELAQQAEKQAAIWERHARAAGVEVPERFMPERVPVSSRNWCGGWGRVACAGYSPR